MVRGDVARPAPGALGSVLADRRLSGISARARTAEQRGEVGHDDTRTDRRTFLAGGLRACAAVSAAALVAGASEASATVARASELPRRADDPAPGAAPGPPTALTVNGLTEALGVDPDDLFFAFRLTDARRGARQSAYRIVVARHDSRGTQTVWDSGPVASGRQAFIAYGGPALQADTEYRWQVASADVGGHWGPLSRAATFVTGLRAGDWRAVWLSPGPGTTVPEIYAYLRTVVRPRPSPVVRATAYVAAAHKYQLWLNGAMVDTGPAFSYPDESYYQATDVTGRVVAGRDNAWGLLHHWYSSGSGRPRSAPGALAQLAVHHADGTVEVFGTDGSWRERPGEWLPGPQRNGSSGEFVEMIDARGAPLGWSNALYDDSSWENATVLGPVGTAPFTTLYALRTRIAEHSVPPVSVRTLPSGSVVVDFGKVIAARPTVTFAEGVDGRTVPMHVGYLLDPDGRVSTTHGTQGTDLSFAYTQRAGPQVFEPYTFLGFRYLQVDEPGEPLGPGRFAALARHAAMPLAEPAAFTTSSPMLDAVWGLCTHSALYASHEQFVDTPTRQKGQFCSDATNESQAVMHAFADTNMSWQGLRDFARSQTRFWPDGRVNEAYPYGNDAEDIPDFTELYPEWVMRYFEHTGDTPTLQRLYPVMQNITDYVARAVDPGTGLVTNLPGGGTDYTYGLVDWPPQMRYGYDMSTVARTTVNILGINAFARTAQAAAVLGDAAGQSAQLARVASLTAAVNTRLLDADGVYNDGLDPGGAPSPHRSQQANALALTYGVAPATVRDAVAAHVAALGIAMGPDHGMELLRGLHAAGLDAHIVHILTDPSGPGWAHILAAGGTFTWEDWEPSDLDGDSMSHGWGSGALVAMQEAFLGVTSLAPGPDGQTAVAVRPPSTGLARAGGEVPTTAGPLGVAWRRTAGHLALSVDIPPNATAAVVLPGTPGAIAEGGRALDTTGLRSTPGPASGTTVHVGAGSYTFRVSTA